MKGTEPSEKFARKTCQGGSPVREELSSRRSSCDECGDPKRDPATDTLAAPIPFASGKIWSWF